MNLDPTERIGSPAFAQLTPFPRPSAPRLPEVPGYTPIRLIGRGGMGAVYEAEQHDPPRRVALKLIARDALDLESAARFTVERQAVARMDHPHVARVYDAGVTVAGVPFFAMELVAGNTLTAYCRGRGLGVRDRLTLFVGVCRAVQHAHQKGVIHRDLKPGNILVTEVDGAAVPKVIDFGVAKLVSAADAGASVTRCGLVAGTPLYMAPEQADPLAHVDTRADVFSLGVILYELLTDTTPLDRDELDKLPPESVLRRVFEQRPTPPSAAVDPRRAAELRGELDWIAGKCLRPDPTERYATADQLADDIGRHLRNETVSARPPSGWYAARKFVRRNRGPVAAAVVMLALLVAGVVGTSVGLVWADEHRRIADEHRRIAVEQRELAEARAEAEATARARAAEARQQADREALASDTVLGFVLFELIAPVDPWARGGGHAGPDTDLTLATVLDRAAARVDTRLPEHPEIRNRLREVLGLAYFALDRYPQAEAQAVRWKEEADGRLPPGAPERGRAASLLARVYALTNRTDKAEPLFHEAVRAAVAEHGEDSPEARAEQENLANGLACAGRVEEAVRLYTGLMATASGPGDRLTMAANLAGLYVHSGQFPKVIELLAEYAEGQASDDGHALTLAPARLHLATAYQRLGDFEKARPLAEAAARTFRERFGPSHLRTLQAGGILAAIQTATDRHTEATRLYADLIPRLKREHGATHRLLDEWLGNLGIIHATAGDAQRAEEVRRERVEVCRKVFGPDAVRTADAEYDLIFSLARVGKLKEAGPIATHCLSVFEKTCPDIWFTAHTHLFLAIVESEHGKVDEVERHLLAAAVWATADRPKGPPPTANQIDVTVGTLVEFYQGQGNRAAELKWRGEWGKRVRETLPPPRRAD